ncbi:MAG TPA: CHC2 zinc finger domain-containing protein [Candidatus Polarisedimenticolia bacterium]|nr:CHC2 zinc finger domain-containing protein [Candidatus Polarisedimenticolia bacterium]
MPYVPPEMKERIKREVSIQRLAEARGIKLRRSGKELIGLCPFHKDTKPSLNIDPVKNVWDCKGACGEGGDVIEWVKRAEGVSFSHALELLKRDYLPSATTSASPPPKICTVPKLPPLFEPTIDDQKLLGVVVDYYHATLKQTPGAQQYLIRRGLQSAEMVEHFRLGFSNRSLNYHLPDKNRVEGARQRGRLEELGIFREKSGHEHFVGSLVIPIFDLSGQVVQMYGRKINDNLRAGTDYHLYLPGPMRGVWNEQALAVSKEIILCEALIDALTFWCAGYRHVTTIYGVNNFTDELRAAFQKYGTKRVYLAYDRDEAGERAAEKHAEELLAMGIECLRVQFPRGMDANEFAVKNQPAAKFLGMYLNRAVWLGKGERPSVVVIESAKAESVSSESVEIEPPPEPEPQIEEQQQEPIAEPTATPAVAEIAEEKTNLTAKEENALALPLMPPTVEPEKVFSLAVELDAGSEEAAAPYPPMPAAPQDWPVLNVPVEIHGEEVIIHQGDRRYRVRCLEKNLSDQALRINLLVSRKNVRGETAFHVDTFDLSSARQRTVFMKQASEELGVKEDVIRHDLGQVFLQLEVLRDEQIKKALQPEETESSMPEEERTAAIKLLRDPCLLDRILEDFAQCGVVGEETNKKVAYLGTVSRLLKKPLAIVVQSSSSAGKSSLMEAVLDFVPEDQRESYTAMTGQSLFYMGEKNLKHKILAIAEQQGAERAAYPLKLLQSEGRIKIASTGKDPVSGKHVTHDYEVEGPVMIFLTTTAYDVDEELLNRCIVLTVNEEQDQTRAIHQKQREAQTLEGMWAQEDRDAIVTLHRNAQRLLRPLRVVNEHVRQQMFPDAMIRTRRDHQKFLTLINAIALLHQHQREIKTSTRNGKTREYIEATADDVKLALQLVTEVLTPSLEELQAQTRRLLLLTDAMVTGECARLGIERLDYRFTRATVRQYTRWGDTQLRVHLRRLEELEYLIVRHGAPGQTFVYQLNFEMDAEGRPVLAGLSQFCSYAGVNGDCAGGARPGSGGIAGDARGEESPVLTRGNGDFRRNLENRSTGGQRENLAVDQPIVAKPNGKANGHGLAKRAGGIK